jgi:predicted RNA polymerase sigma factor
VSTSSAGFDSGAESLLRTLAPQVLGALVRRYGHFDTAEDATQEAFVSALGALPYAATTLPVGALIHE